MGGLWYLCRHVADFLGIRWRSLTAPPPEVPAAESQQRRSLRTVTVALGREGRKGELEALGRGGRKGELKAKAKGSARLMPHRILVGAL